MCSYFAVAHPGCARDVQAIDNSVNSGNSSDTLERKLLHGNARRLRLDRDRAILIKGKMDMFQPVVESDLAAEGSSHMLQ